MARYQGLRRPTVRFCDLRRESYDKAAGFLERATKSGAGDPKGYREVRLDSESFLECQVSSPHICTERNPSAAKSKLAQQSPKISAIYQNASPYSMQ